MRSHLRGLESRVSSKIGTCIDIARALSKLHVHRSCFDFCKNRREIRLLVKKEEQDELATMVAVEALFEYC